MLADFNSHNDVDHDGNPRGGYAAGMGFYIRWEEGPLGRGPNRAQPDGAFVETIIAVAKQRLEFYQSAGNGKFRCPENEMAIVALGQALQVLDARTKAREQREVEGTHTP